MGGFEFQAVLLLLILYLVFTGNTGIAATAAMNAQAKQVPIAVATSAG
jgi:hypothetical protein